VILRKFHDENGNTVADLTERALPGIHFEFIENNRVHRRITDTQGAATFCMDHAASVQIREVGREQGGLWRLTTVIPDAWGLTCPARELWIGNAEVELPKTGSGGTYGLGKSPSTTSPSAIVMR
jgi:hypothetical protein